MRQPSPLPDGLELRGFTVNEATALGVPHHRLRAADLERPFHGVRTMTTPTDLVDRCMAYAAKMAPWQFFCSRTAAELHGLPVPTRMDDRIHVASAAPHNAPRDRRITGHQLRVYRGDVVEYAGLRVSSLERSWCEFAAIASLSDVVAAGDRMLWRRDPLSTRDRLGLAVLHHPGRRGKRTLERALLLLTDRADSPPESWVRVILTEAGVGGLVPNLEVVVAGRTYFIDVAVPSRMLAIEYHGDYHRDPKQWREDVHRKSELERVGWRVLELTAGDLADPAAIVRRVLLHRRRR